MGAKKTIRVSQKHAERFTFMLIIFILLGLLVRSETTNLCDNSTVGYVAKYGIDDIRQAPAIENDFDSNASNVTDENESDTNNGSFLDGYGDSDEEASKEATQSETADKEPVYANNAIIKVSEIDYEIIDDNKAKIVSFIYEVNNNYPDLDKYTVKYYIYDEKSHPAEETEPKRPFIEVGNVRPANKISGIGVVDKYVFNLEYKKTLKFELINSDGKIEHEIVKQLMID